MAEKKKSFNSAFLRQLKNDATAHHSSPDATNPLLRTIDANKSVSGLARRVDGQDRQIEKIKREVDRVKRSTINSMNQAAQEVAARASKEVEEKHAVLASDLQSKSDSIKEDVGTLRKELSSDRYRTIEVLAFFVAFFTFVSIEFQLFANITNYLQVVSLTLILFGIMTFFVVLLSRVIGLMNGQVALGKKILGASLVVIVVGAFLGLGSEKLGWAQSPTEHFVDRKAQQCQRMMDNITEKGSESPHYNAFFALGCQEMGVDNDTVKKTGTGE